MNQQLVFLKYQSLGNDFILLDWRLEQHPTLEILRSNPEWKACVSRLCHRNFGIGADGVLVLTDFDRPECWIFNPDGFYATTCLNGARCVACYLQKEHSFLLKMGPNSIRCIFDGQEVITEVPYSVYQGALSCTVQEKTFAGHIADVGNPHFIIFDQIDLEECRKYGPILERASVFPEGSNISFAWERNSNSYDLLTHERGAGLTYACSSAGAALIRILYELKKIRMNQEIQIHMRGGVLHGSLLPNNTLALRGQAHPVFSGSIYVEKILDSKKPTL